MDIKDTAEKVVNKTDDFIAEEGLGSSQLKKARQVQRGVNIAAVAGVVVVAGVAMWFLTRSK